MDGSTERYKVIISREVGSNRSWWAADGIVASRKHDERGRRRGGDTLGDVAQSYICRLFESNDVQVRWELYEIFQISRLGSARSEEFQPHAKDGEVQSFKLWGVEELLHEVSEGDKLRPAMRLVVTDFLIRHGIITADNEPQLAEIQAAMHRERMVLPS